MSFQLRRSWSSIFRVDNCSRSLLIDLSSARILSESNPRHSTSSKRKISSSSERQLRLRVLVRAPTYLSPVKHPDRALQRRNEVIDAMIDAHAISEAEAATA